MNLEMIQEMWSKDSIIDPDELHTASLDVARLHSKYFQLYNDLKLLRARSQEDATIGVSRTTSVLFRKVEPEIYEKDPFPYKVREKDALQRYLDADERLTAGTC